MMRNLQGESNMSRATMVVSRRSLTAIAATAALAVAVGAVRSQETVSKYRDWPKDILPSFNGYSIGTWRDDDGDGRYDTLDIETRGFKSPRTFEGSGLPLHEDGATVIKERLSLDRSDKGLLRNEITVIDNALTRPWTVSKVYKREPNANWDVVDCAEYNPHVVVGKETY